MNDVEKMIKYENDREEAIRNALGFQFGEDNIMNVLQEDERFRKTLDKLYDIAFSEGKYNHLEKFEKTIDRFEKLTDRYCDLIEPK